jgi:hypothetical protein
MECNGCGNSIGVGYEPCNVEAHIMGTGVRVSSFTRGVHDVMLDFFALEENESAGIVNAKNIDGITRTDA